MNFALHLFLLLAILLGTTHAHAQTSQTKTEAKQLFVDAMQRFKQEDYAAACDKLEKSLNLYYAMGAQYQLARCNEEQGKLATAYSLYTEVANTAMQEGMRDREGKAREQAAALKPRLPQLTIHVPISVTTLPGLHITFNGEALKTHQWGTPFPIDPGEYVITATAPNHQPWENRVNAVERNSSTVTVAMVSTANEPETAVESGEPSNAWPTVGLVIAGTGAAAIGASVVLGVMAKGKGENANCNAEDICSLQGRNDRHSAKQLSDAGTGVFIAGAAMGVGGLLMWWLASAEGHLPATAFHVNAGPGVGYVELQGPW